MHSGRFAVVAGKPLDPRLLSEDVSAVEEGSCNLVKQIENMRLFGIPVVVAINVFQNDTENEIDLVKKIAKASGADDCVISRVWAQGSKGGVDLAKAVVEASKKSNNFKFLYPLEMPIKEKIKIIAKKIYGAKDVEYAAEAEEKIKKFTEAGFDKLPICMAKTHLSLSHDPKLKGRPHDFILPIRDIRPSIGAGFLYPLCGTMQTMPGLPSHPAGEKVDIDENGRVKGLF
jgi:formyltetrahydrofolate synthetase